MAASMGRRLGSGKPATPSEALSMTASTAPARTRRTAATVSTVAASISAARQPARAQASQLARMSPSIGKVSGATSA
jgi:hypothetical protein